MNIAKETKLHFITFYKSKNSQTSFHFPLDFKIVWTVFSLTWTNCRLLQASWDLAFLFSLSKFFFLEAPQLKRRQWHPTLVHLPGKSHRRRNLVGCSPWGCEVSDTTEDFTFTFHFHALEKEMATHSSVLAQKIPGMGEPGGLPSIGSHRVGHD